MPSTSICRRASLQAPLMASLAALFALAAFAFISLIAPTAAASSYSSSLVHGMTATSRRGSEPRQMVRRGQEILFWASDPAHGNALRRLNLTTGQVNMVWDFNLPFSQISSQGTFAHLPVDHGWVILLRDAVWRTDGTPAGTSRLLQWKTESGGADRSQIVHDGIAYFSAEDPAHGHELWRSDGTPAGTWMVKDLRVGPDSSQPEHFAVVGHRIFFAAGDSEHGVELWVTDGTADGTRLAADLVPGFSSGLPRDLCGLGETVFFEASAGTLGRVLWRSDGTPEGTRVVNDSPTGDPPKTPSTLIAVDNWVYFTAHTNANGRELWKTDGTAAGTRLVRDLWPGRDGSEPSHLQAVNGRVLFTAYLTGDTNQPRLFTSNGTSAGTVAIQSSSLRPKWIGPGDANGGPTMADGAAWFIASSGSSLHSGLWRTDGTVAGTRQVYAPAPATWTASVAPILAVDGHLILTGSTLGDPPTSGEIWKWNIEGRTLQPVADLCPEGWDAPPSHPLSTPLGFFFRGFSPAAGFELWRTLGTPATSTLLKDLQPGSVSGFGGSDQNILSVGPAGHVYFQGATPAAGAELWRSDGTASGTTLVRDLAPGSKGSFPSGLTALGDGLVFAASGKLWTSNGTGDGTTAILPMAPNTEESRPEFLTRFGDRVFFSASDATHGTEIWSSDGTAAGTRLLRDLYTGTGTVWPRLFGTAGPLLFFEQHGTTRDYGLYATDGTSDGTRRLSDARPFSPGDAASIGPDFYFVHAPTPDSQSLWRSDGTANGTRQITTLAATRLPEPGWRLTTAGPFVFFHLRDMVLGNQLWRSDGTASGTVPLVPETPAWDPIRNIELLGSIGSEVYFAATTYRHGRELWVSDGTPAGTQLALDLGPGETSGLPLWIGRHGDRLFGLFAADPQSGSPSIRSVVPPNARPVFLGLEIDTWPDVPTQFSAERLRSLIEAPPDTPLELVPANPIGTAGGGSWTLALSTAGGSWTLIDDLFTYSPPPGHLGSDQLPLEIRYPGGPPLTTFIQVTVQPTPPTPTLEPTLTRRSSGPLEVRAFTRRGHRHAFERSLDLTVWTPLEIRVPTTSEPSLWIDPAPPSPAAHYRLRVVP